MEWDQEWETRLEITAESVWLLVTDQGRIVLEARFTGHPVHRRALVLILEALALWQGKRLCAVITAGSVVHPTLGLGEDGDEWLPENPLVEYMHVESPSRYHRDSGRCWR
jgi:hypothetical protein